MPFDLGDTVRLAADCKNAGGTLTDATSVALTITLPDGSTASPAVTNPPGQTGKYTLDYTSTQAGRHAVRWVFTGPASAYTDSFDVREASPPAILSLADAKAHLDITTTTEDDELRGWIEAVTHLVEQFTGVCARGTVVEDHSIQPSGVRELALRRTPVLSLTSAVAILTGGTSYTVGDLDVDTRMGIVRLRSGGRMYGPLRITYTAGRAVIPANITAAAKIILQHLWRTQYGASRALAGIGGGDDFNVTEPIAGFGYAIPNRALQLLEPHRLPPGVA
ncbi:head-tail connector protein [Streptomyces himalayensis]|uniref:Phage gp6-like head-tail connector protein n=1 Tax=Streptomyces himalayensis subsp. himalayensis TaxID=2756131 RepID=A0A7W0IDA9_9ACTN|nr:head-tail connector protein [Streptomyces himalayensis]MBA2951590.1 phage gp6-like head-tail connector protein [Streptomyces himalayensis subsp. himalayensis]